MAGNQPARFGVAETTDEFMERRRREVAQRAAAEAAGRHRWVASTSTGENLPAPRPADVVALGARGARGANSQGAVAPVRPDSAASRSPNQEPGIRYGALYAPPPDDLAELRRQQAAFADVAREIDKQNSWFAIPALAPEAVVGGLEIAGAIGARLAAPQVARAPLVLSKRDPYPRVGDTWATRAGRRAHKAFQALVDAKPGWDAEKSVAGKSGGILRPDARTPARNPVAPNDRFVVDLKPDTPSGRRAGARAVEKYVRELGNRARIVFYDPKPFI